MHVSKRIKDKVNARVAECMAIAKEHYGREFPHLLVTYDKRGKTAGVAHLRENRINLNSTLLVENEADFIARTVGHEVAHMIDYWVNGVNHIRKGYRLVQDQHGVNWKYVMLLFGQTPSRCHSYNTTNSTVGSRTKHVWVCGCGGKEMSLGAKRHARQQLTPTFYQRGHTAKRCGAYTHTHDLVRGQKVPVVQARRVSIELKPGGTRPTVTRTTVTKPVKMPKAGTKMARAVELVRDLPYKTHRKMVIAVLQNELNMSRAGAQTYYYNARKVLEQK